MPIYMKIEGVEGPATGKYKDWIELESCQFGSPRHGTSAGGRATNRENSAPAISEIVVTKLQDSASSQLFRLSLEGEGKKTTIVFVKENNVPYLELELENMLISNYSVSGHRGSSGLRPLESLSLNFTKITYKTMAVADNKGNIQTQVQLQMAQ